MAEPTTPADPVADLRSVVTSWQDFYRQFLRAASGNAELATIKLIDLMMSSGMDEAGAGALAMAVRIIQEGPGQIAPDDLVVDPIPGHPEFEDSLRQMKANLLHMVEHGQAHIEHGDSDAENTACTYEILMRSPDLSAPKMAGYVAGAVTELAKLGWKP